MKKRNQETAEHRNQVKQIIYKLIDDADPSTEKLHFTLAGLRNHAVNVLWPNYDSMISEESEDEVQDFTQLEIFESDEYLFAYLESWGYNIERIKVIDIK